MKNKNVIDSPGILGTILFFVRKTIFHNTRTRKLYGGGNILKLKVPSIP